MTNAQYFFKKIENMTDDDLYTAWTSHKGQSSQAYWERAMMAIELRDRGCFEPGNEPAGMGR